MTGRPLLACLLPVRNGSAHLDGWLASVERFADVVVALDDGSTDDTRARLEASPLVTRVLTNPVRPSYRGWDDAANRTRLLAAAGEVDPRWVMFLDADERLSADDAVALRTFLWDEADPDAAYFFRLFRMVDDEEHYDRMSMLVGRLFAYRAGLELSTQRLHLVPIPTSIPRHQWRRTTLRIQHLADLTEEDRRAHFEKYREVDPDWVFQADYSNLLLPAARVRRWRPRAPHMPVVANAAGARPAPAVTMAAARG